MVLCKVPRDKRFHTAPVVIPNMSAASATVYRARDDIRVLAGSEPLDLADVVPGWSPTLSDLFAIS